MLITGIAAALPVIVSTVRAAAAGWMPLGDDAGIAIRAYDVLSLHPPLAGPISVSSQVIGEPVQSPGPLLFWLLAIPVRISPLAPAIALGLVNTCAIVGIVALARRRGGRPLMFATAAAVAAMCGSLDAWIFSDIWGPAAALLPFTLSIFLAWSVACGEYRLLPLTAFVASFTTQAHLTYAFPTIALIAIAGAFLAISRRAIPRPWLVATLAVAIVCWSFPIAEEVIHRPGNVERIVEAGTAGEPRYGAAAGWRSVARAVGIPPWWLRPPLQPFDRLAEIGYEHALTTVTAALVLAALAAAAVIALRTRRRELAAGVLLALGVLASLGAVTASTPSSGALFSVIAYTLWWAAPAGMFAWLVLGWGAISAFAARAARLRVSAAVASTASVLGVAAVGGIVAAGGEPPRFEHGFRPIRTITDRVRAEAPGGATVLVTGSVTEIGWNLQAATAYALRRGGLRFVTYNPPGIGSRYDPSRHRHDAVIRITDGARPGPGAGRVIARAAFVNTPSDALPRDRARRVVSVRLERGAGFGRSP